MLTDIFAVAGVALLFAVFGLMTRRWARFRRGGCGCGSPAGSCGACPENLEGAESSHAKH